MSSRDLTWRPLPLPPLPGLPVLLVSAEMGKACYTVRVTDMANVWTESLDRKAICMRGWSRNTSIDPSDTPENMAKFLASLETALDSSRPGHEETSVDLSLAGAADAGKDGLVVHVTCALPGFDPLEWPFHLQKSNPSSVATDLVLPLIRAQFAKQRQVESLVRLLGHKDTVLAKLLDKLEAMGTGLEHAFTALSGRKKVTRSVAEDKVKGLAPFDRRTWTAKLGDEVVSPDDTRHLLQSVFGDSGLDCGAIVDVDESPALDGWWRDFEGTSRLAHRRLTPETPPAKGEPSTPARSADVGDEDDDFQVQATPPRLGSGAKRKATSRAPTRDAASPTGSEDATREKKSPMAVSESTQQSAAPWTSKMEVENPGKSKASALGDDSETASEASDDDAGASVPRSSRQPAPEPRPAAGARRGGLGRIGGGAPKAHSPDAEESKEIAHVPAPRKLGVIGNSIGGSSSTKPVQEDDGRGRALTGKEDASVEEPRETSQERADRRREELKAELQKKAAAGPAKKKRRF